MVNMRELIHALARAQALKDHNEMIANEKSRNIR